MITLEDFEKVNIKVGTILEVKINKKTRVPAYKMKIDFGELGIKNSSAQITDLYKEEDLIGKQIIAVTNFNPIHVGDIKSEVRILGLENKGGVILLHPDKKAVNGSKLY